MKAFAVCICLTSFGLAAAQQPEGKLSFEVASIKPSDPNPENGMWIGISADRAMVQYTNITLKDCIRAAYRMRDFQIVGPEWMTKARFEISAKLPGGTLPEQVPEMLQALLTERFKLAVRRDTEEKPVYALTVGKGGPKLKAADGTKIETGSPTALGPDGRPRQAMRIMFLASGITITAPSANLAGLADMMSRFTVRPVIDMTGLEGQYEFNLSFTPETTQGTPLGADRTQASGDPAPTLFEAVQQYGLRLDSRRAPIERLTVTHLERMPTEN